jgi:alpha-beta hydrolase superfamily lysophospholipase
MEQRKYNLKIPSYVRWIGWVLLVQFLLINISAALYAYKFTHVYDSPSLRNAKPAKNIFVKTWRLFSGPRQPKSIITETPTFPFDTIKLKTENGIFIDAWYSKTDSAAKGTVILFHGIGANKGMLLYEAYEFRYQRYNVMLVDFRAHGNSGGKTTTIGVRESEEVKLAYDYVAGKGEKNIFIWGSSMGAVVAAKAISDYNLKPSGIILEMPFASLQTHLQARARANGFQGFPEKPFGFFVTWWMGMERGFNGFKHKTTSYVKKMHCPVLMQYGALDSYVEKNETDKVYNAIASANKKLVVYDRAGHESIAQNDPVKWRIEIERFLMENTK